MLGHQGDPRAHLPLKASVHVANNSVKAMLNASLLLQPAVHDSLTIFCFDIVASLDGPTKQ